jgi:hypothetical protein
VGQPTSSSVHCSPFLSLFIMSRRPQQQPSIDTSQPEVPEDELLSATGEGDEVMEEAEEQEGYSACVTLLLRRNMFTSSSPFLSSCQPYVMISQNPSVTLLSRLTSVVNPYVILNMDQLVLFFTWPRLLLRGRRGLY